MRWQDFALLGLRLVGIAGFALIVMVAGSPPVESVALASAVGAGLVLVAGLLAFIAATRPAAPYAFIVADLVIAGSFIHIAQADPVITLAIVAFLALSMALTVTAVIGVFYVVVLLAVALGMIVFHASGQDLSQNVDFGAVFETYGAVIAALVVVSAGAIAWSYADSRFGARQQRHLHKVAEERAEQLQRMQERAEAITEMMRTVTATLDYQKILDAALDIGDLSLRNKAQSQWVISMVLLFSYDDRLYIASARGLKPEHQAQTLRASGGILARTLKESMPIISTAAASDPVLSQIHGFKQMRSLLCVPLHAHYENFGLVVYGTTEADAFDPNHVDILQSIGAQATVALQNAALSDNLRREKYRVLQMEEDARKSLVRDLHDIPTQTVSGMVMRVEIISRLVKKDPDQALVELEGIKKTVTQAVTELRHVLFKLRPLALENQGLVAAFDQLAEKMRANYKQNVRVEASEEVNTLLDETQQGALFYLVEEATNNARKYAEAKLIKISAGRKNGSLVVQIADNGKGFDMGTNGSRGMDSFGMTNMRERAELLNGRLNIKSEIGKGTTVQIVIPIEAAGNRALQDQMSATRLASVARRNM